MARKPRVAIVRGPYLNPWEMQTYASLDAQFELRAFAASGNIFEEDQIAFPVVHLHQPKEIGFDIPRWRGFCNIVTRRLFGSEERLLGLERALEHSDLIHAAETFNYFSLQAVRTKVTIGAPVVLTVWENIPHNRDNVSHYARCKQDVRAGVDLYLAVTEQAKAALVCEGVDQVPIRVVGAGIDTVRFCPGPIDPMLRARFGLSRDETVILFVGRLLRSKGIYDLVAAIQLLREFNTLPSKTYRLLIVGKGPEESQLRNLTRTAGLDDVVIFAGAVSYVDMPGVHRLADIFVLPSVPTPTWEEQFGMVLAESMATGKAVIGTQSGAIPEVVGDAGLLVPPAVPESLARALHDLLLDDAMRHDLGQRARKRAESTYAHQIVAARIADAYRSLL